MGKFANAQPNLKERASASKRCCPYTNIACSKVLAHRSARCRDNVWTGRQTDMTVFQPIT
ncbi:hypothetical protein J6590_070963 [Homalodisca vitripennis]|nr:hypothetical protein J6590_070963 [Homalodisca vitripennis]